MSPSDRILGVYLHLARASQLRLQPLQRDKLLALAGVQAESMGLEPIAALCRHKILAHNPQHLVGAWPTIAAALADERFLSYLKQLQRRYSREKAEHMLDALGIQMGRERELYASDLEYAAALLDTDLTEIQGILARHPSRLAVGDPRWLDAAATVSDGVNLPRAIRMQSVLIVWVPYLLSLLAWAVATASLFRGRP
jgi:hypothetical protein